MKFTKYLTLPLCFMIALIYSSYGMEKSELFNEKISKNTHYTSSFKLPSLKTMLFLSVVAMVDTVDARLISRRPTSILSPTNPPRTLQPTPCVFPRNEISTFNRNQLKCNEECMYPPLGSFNGTTWGTCQPQPIPNGASLHDSRIAQCLIPIDCKDCKSCIRKLWIDEGYKNEFPG